MKSKDTLNRFREMDERELQERYHELMKEMFNLRFQSTTAQLSSPARFTQVRREIARIKTVAKERELNIG